MNITGIKSAKYGSSFHKSPLFFCQRQAHNSVNTPVLPSFTPGCRGWQHGGVYGIMCLSLLKKERAFVR